MHGALIVSARYRLEGQDAAVVADVFSIIFGRQAAYDLELRRHRLFCRDGSKFGREGGGQNLSRPVYTKYMCYSPAGFGTNTDSVYYRWESIQVH